MAVLLTANAQGLWQKHELEADELKGQKAETAYIYTNPDVGSFILLTTSNPASSPAFFVASL